MGMQPSIGHSIREADTVSLMSCVVSNFVTIKSCTVFLQPDAAATIYFAAHFVQLLLEGGVYFFGKPAETSMMAG